MMSFSFSFQRQLQVGKSGEDSFLAGYHSRIVKLHDRNITGDFLRQHDKKVIELKTDSYPLARTPNFFMEMYSNDKKKTLGGPYRAFDNGTDIFIYLFASDGVYFEFDDVQKLVLLIDKVVKKQKIALTGIPNKGYTTLGYKIPRESLSSLFLEHRLISPVAEEGLAKAG